MIKRVLVIFFMLLTVTLTTASTEIVRENQGILTKDDYDFADLDNEQPALRIPTSGGEWIESYNDWQCFPTNIVSIEITKVDYNGRKDIPSLRIEHDGESVKNFDIEHDIDWSTDKVLTHWQGEFHNSDQICIFAAFAQKIDDEELYYVNKIKFGNTYWVSSEEWEN